MAVTYRILSALLVGYLFGSVPFGFLVGKFNGIDIRRHGSGNIGATNVTRVLSRGWGIACFLADFLKGLVPVLLITWWSSSHGQALEYAPILAAFAAVAGHVLPVWLRFRGGKGMATSIGVVVALAPFCVLLSLVSWYLVFLFSRYVSLASLVAAVVLPLCGLVHRQLRPGAVSVPTIVLLFVLSAVIIVTHRANIKRLLRGREHRFTRTSRR